MATRGYPHFMHGVPEFGKKNNIFIAWFLCDNCWWEKIRPDGPGIFTSMGWLKSENLHRKPYFGMIFRDFPAIFPLNQSTDHQHWQELFSKYDVDRDQLLSEKEVQIPKHLASLGMVTSKSSQPVWWIGRLLGVVFFELGSRNKPWFAKQLCHNVYTYNYSLTLIYLFIIY